MIKKTEFAKRVMVVINKLDERKKVASDLGMEGTEKYSESVELWRSECMQDIEEIYTELKSL